MFPERTLSNFDNVSIGTGLAFETLFKPDNGYYDPEREVPKLKESYRVIWLNGYTILRGIISSISTTEEKNKFLGKNNNTEELVSVFLEEYVSIFNLLSSKGYIPILFIPNYKKNNTLEKLDRNILHVDDNDSYTSKTLMLINRAIMLIRKDYYSGLLKELSTYLVSNNLVKKDLAELVMSELKSGFKIKLIAAGGDLMFTHLYVDMLNHKYVNRLCLLESHTGRIKRHYEINSKYPLLKDMDFKTVVPFIESMYYIFGDNNLVKPVAAKIRKKLYDIFLRNKINSTSSKVAVDKVILNHKKEIDELDPDFIEFYKNLKLVY